VDTPRGGQLSNNKWNCERGLEGFVQRGENPGWQIRPTLYSHIVEFTENGGKSVVLVYHAMQIDSIHDWERVEIRLDDVAGDPGGGESIVFVDAADSAATSYWAAGTISSSNAQQMAAGVPSLHPVNTSKVKRIRCELQDTADILPSHLDSGGTPNGTRGLANGRIDSHGSYWYQHDYFAHTGAEASGEGGDAEQGHWLCLGWHLEASGGFDGRWVQLFPD
jgi:hypothetical protein